MRPVSQGGRWRRVTCDSQCAVKQTLSALRAATVGRIENSGSHLNVIGPQVRRLRKQKGWTQEQLATKLQLCGWDTSRESVMRFENQDRRVPDLEVFVLARVLGVKADEFFPRNLRGRIRDLAPLYRVKLSRGQVPPVA